MSSCDVIVTLMRHGETHSNANKQLGSDEDCLSDTGKSQVISSLKKISKIPIERIFTSDAVRACETADIISKTINAPIVKSTLIREKSSGSWSGKKESGINWSELKGDFYTKKIPGGESINDVIERADEFKRELEKDCKNTLVISHGTFIKIVLAEMLGCDVKEFILKTTIPNGAFTTLTFNTATHSWKIKETSFKVVL